MASSTSPQLGNSAKIIMFVATQPDWAALRCTVWCMTFVCLVCEFCVLCISAKNNSEAEYIINTHWVNFWKLSGIYNRLVKKEIQNRGNNIIVSGLTQTNRHGKYCNPRCACAPRVNSLLEFGTHTVTSDQKYYTSTIIARGGSHDLPASSSAAWLRLMIVITKFNDHIMHGDSSSWRVQVTPTLLTLSKNVRNVRQHLPVYATFQTAESEGPWLVSVIMSSDGQ